VEVKTAGGGSQQARVAGAESLSGPRLVDRRHAALRGLVFVASEFLGHLRDPLLLLFDEGAKLLDRLPRVLGRDAP
jgi:hypothetical protein